MKITKKEHKEALWLLFFETKQTMNGEFKVQIEPDLDKLTVCGATARKLAPKENVKAPELPYGDNDIFFTAEEWIYLKELFRARPKWPFSMDLVVEELKEIFKKAEEEEKKEIQKNENSKKQ